MRSDLYHALAERVALNTATEEPEQDKSYPGTVHTEQVETVDNDYAAHLVKVVNL